MKNGRLILIPAGLGSENPSEVLPKSTLDQIYVLRHFVAERAKSARAYLKSINYPVPFSEVEVVELNKHDKENYQLLLKPCLEGLDVGLLSEAGVPGVADPGGGVVAAAHKMNVQVVPLVGASSILLALMASGMNGQQFAFHGYLPKDESALLIQIKSLEGVSRAENVTQIFIETPYRNEKLKSILMKNLAGDTRLCLAANITTEEEYIQTKTISEWKNTPFNIDRKPTVFLIYAGADVK